MTEPVADDAADPRSVPIDEIRARSLGDRLRRAFDEVVSEPLPDAFAALLRQLE